MTRPEQTPLKPIAVIAGMAGNMMEWYDFALYGVMAPVSYTHLTLPTILRV